MIDERGIRKTSKTNTKIKKSKIVLDNWKNNR